MWSTFATTNLDLRFLQEIPRTKNNRRLFLNRTSEQNKITNNLQMSFSAHTNLQDHSAFRSKSALFSLFKLQLKKILRYEIFTTRTCWHGNAAAVTCFDLKIAFRNLGITQGKLQFVKANVKKNYAVSSITHMNFAMLYFPFYKASHSASSGTVTVLLKIRHQCSLLTFLIQIIYKR